MALDIYPVTLYTGLNILGSALYKFMIVIKRVGQLVIADFLLFFLFIIHYRFGTSSKTICLRLQVTFLLPMLPKKGSSEEIAINHNPLSLWHLAKLSQTSVVLSDFQRSQSLSCFLLIKSGPLSVAGLKPTIS